MPVVKGKWITKEKPKAPVPPPKKSTSKPAPATRTNIPKSTKAVIAAGYKIEDEAKPLKERLEKLKTTKKHLQAAVKWVNVPKKESLINFKNCSAITADKVVFTSGIQVRVVSNNYSLQTTLLNDAIKTTNAEIKSVTDKLVKLDSKYVKNQALINGKPASNKFTNKGKNKGGVTRGTGKTSGTGNDAPTVVIKPATGKVTYNAPSVAMAYFNPKTDFETEILLGTGGTPKRVTEASELWKETGKAYKGMIQSFIVPNSNQIGSQDGLKPELGSNIDVNDGRYAFQFLYNPSSIDMSYAGSPKVDIGLEISGRDKLPLVGAAAGTSTVSFNLLINRMPDLYYLNAAGTYYSSSDKQTYVNDPIGSPSWRDLYGGVTVSQADLLAIKNRGTMYDVEFLLRTLIGYGLKSQLRGFTTADIGYLGAYPVELHLGKSLRYLVTISQFDITHTIFTEDMIPIFTNIRITCNRLPDYNYSGFSYENKAAQ